MPAALLGQNKPADQTEMKVKTAFMILVTENGDYILETNINAPVVPEVPVTNVDVERAINALAEELKAQRIAQAVVNRQMMMAMQAQEAAQNQAMMQQLKMPK
jgi:hypothetical protein